MFYPTAASPASRVFKLGLLALVLTSGAAAQPAAPASPVGMFESHADIGITPAAGKAAFDADKKSYALTGGGNNIWAKVDAFHFAWKKMSGDFSFTADIAFLDNPSGTSDVHRKGCLMIRQSLDADSPYVDAALHGNGLTALQFRDAKGEATREVQSNLIGPVRVRFEKHGDNLTLFVGQAGEDPKYTGAAYALKFTEPFYLGLAVGAHNANDTSLNLETAVFSNVELKTDLPATTPKLYSAIETQVSNPGNAAQSQNTDRTVLYVAEGAIEGPVWLPDNSGIVFSTGGKLFRLPMKMPPAAQRGGRGGRGAAAAGSAPAAPAPTPGAAVAAAAAPSSAPAPVAARGGGATPTTTPILGATTPTATGEPVQIPIGDLIAVRRVHGLSPDGMQIIFVDRTHGTAPAGRLPPANTYIVPLAGGTPRLLTPTTGAGSSLSPDGKTLVFDTDTVADIFTIPTDGSAPATRLTTGTGKNYGPQFSHDGSFILFCSDRSGTMQLWRMKPDGTEPVQLTTDDNNNWFPHLSANDASALFVTYPKAITGDPANSPVQIRRLNLATRTIDTMARILGGPASAPTWSPNNAQLSFVSYQLVY